MDCVRTSANSLILAVASLTCSSVKVKLSCSTRDLTAFHPVKRWLGVRSVVLLMDIKGQSKEGEGRKGHGEDLPNRHVTGHTEIRGVEDLVSGRVGEDSLGVNTGLVGEGAKPGDVVVAACQYSNTTTRLAHDSQRNGDLDRLGHEVLQLSQSVQVVLALDVLWVGDHHTGNQTTERGDTVSLSDTELCVRTNLLTLQAGLTYNTGVDVGGTSLEGGVGVCNGCPSV